MGEPLNHDSYSDDYLRGILDRVKTIAMVGASEHWNRPSYFVMKYLQDKGYRVIPVNPRASAPEILGEKVYKSSPRFRTRSTWSTSSAAAKRPGRIVDEAIEKGAKVVWMQIGVRNDAAANKAEASRPIGGDEPLPQDRTCTAPWRTRLERRQHRDHLVQATGSCHE